MFFPRFNQCFIQLYFNKYIPTCPVFMSVKPIFAFLLLFAFALIAFNPARAQVTITSNDTSICAGAQVTLRASYTGRIPHLINLPDDKYSGIISLPFPFTFYGNTYTQCLISSNGYITFNTGTPNSFSPYMIFGPVPNPGNSDLQNSIMAGFADLFPNNSGDIDWAVVGTAPNRKFVVTWCNMPFYSCRTNFIAFQAILYEGSNLIDFQINRKDNCNTGNFGGTSGLTVQGLQKDATVADIVPGRNATFWSSYLEGMRFTPAGSNAYTLTSVPYNFISRAAWYTNNTSFLSTDSIITVSPTATTFYVYKTDCADNFSDTVTVTVRPAPSISLGTVVQPTTCNSSDGSITLNSLLPGTAYTILYNKNGNNVSLTGTSTTSGSYTITGLPAGSYTGISVTLNSCTSHSVGPVTLTTSGVPPTPVALASPNPLCAGNTLNLSTTPVAGNTYTWAGPNGFSANTASASVSNIATAGNGTYYVTATSTTTFCNSAAGSVNVVVNATPVTPVIAANTPLCSGGTLNLSTTPVSGATYSWTGPNGFTASSAAPTISNAGTVASGTYNLVVTNTAGNCASGTGSTNVTVNPTPVIANTIPVNPSSCNGSNGSIGLTGLQAGTAYIINYSRNGIPQTATVTAGTTGIATIPGLNAGSYSGFSASSLNCTSPVLAISILLKDPDAPATMVAQTNVACFGNSNGSATVTAAGGAQPYTYAWSPAGGTAATASGLPAGTYTVTVKDGNNCQANQSVTITQPAAAITIVPNAGVQLCAGNTLSITASVNGGTPPYTYVWNGPNSYSTTNAAVMVNAITTAAAGTYNLTVTDSRGCTASSATVVTVNTPPAQPAAISGAASVCGGSANTYRIVPVASATSYAWTLPSSPAGWMALSAAGLDSIRVTAAAAAGTGDISVTAINGCGASMPQTMPVTVVTIPATPGAITGDSIVCIGISRTYTISPVPLTATYMWTVPAGWGAPVVTGGTSMTTIPAAATGAITVKATNACGTSAVSSLPVRITNSIPAQPGAITGLTDVCGGTAQIYRVSKITNASGYSWTAGGNGWSVTTPALDTFAAMTAGTAGATISVTASNGCGVSPARTLAVNVTNKPSAAGVISGPDSVCTGTGTVTFSTGQINEATSYVWTLPTGWSGTSATNTINSTTGTAPGNVTVSVSGFNSCGTGPASQKNIVVNNPVTPAVSVTVSGVTTCAGDPVTFTANPVNGGASPLYQWRVNGVSTGALSSTSVFTVASLNNGDVISVIMKTSLPCAAAGGWATATLPALSIMPKIVPGININATMPPDLCNDVPVTFYSNIVGGGTSPAYQWWKNAQQIAGATGNTYMTSGLSNRDTIRVVLKSNATCRTVDTVSSNKMGVSVSPYLTPVITISVNPGTSVGAGQQVIFTASVANAGANPQVHWKRNGQTIAGTTGITWTTNSLRDGDVISAELESGAQCATPFVVSSGNVLQMHISSGIGGVATDDGISLYPNPNDGSFIIQIKGNAMSYVQGQHIHLEAINGLGQLVYKSAITPDRKDWSVNIQLSEKVANGIYMLSIWAEDNPQHRANLKFEVKK